MRHITDLNRMKRWNGIYAEGGEVIEHETDARHADLLRKQMELSDENRGVSPPGGLVRQTPESEMQLDRERAATLRSACMRLSYPALDRQEVQFIAKEEARGMSNPAERHWQSLKRATRDLVTAPRTWSWKWQRWPLKVIGFSDMDWVGCSVARRSMGCKIFKLGLRTLLTSSTTQTWIALSSGEAEFYGTVKTVSRLMSVGDLLT